MRTHFFIILGMHRSGTSFITRCLNVCGVYLGKNLMSYNRVSIFNPKGNWENYDFYTLSEQLMGENTVKWDDIPIDLRCSEELKQKIKNEFEKLVYDSHLSAGLKDPRMLLILDSIIDIIPNNKLFVGIFRHPLKVAESLKIRNNFDYSKSINLWKAYNIKLLTVLEKNDVFLFNFDWPKEKFYKEFKNLISKTGLINTNIDSVFSEELHRSDKTFDENYRLPQEVEELYEKLNEKTKLNSLIEVTPINFNQEEARKIMEKMITQINELSEVRKFSKSKKFMEKNVK